MESELVSRRGSGTLHPASGLPSNPRFSAFDRKSPYSEKSEEGRVVTAPVGRSPESRDTHVHYVVPSIGLDSCVTPCHSCPLAGSYD